MKLNYKKTLLVGFAFFLICVFWQAYDTIIPKILTDKFGMSQKFSGIVMAFDNVLALFLLPLFGSLSDRHKGKRGKRTPFIIVGTIVACIALLLLSVADNLQKDNISAVDIDEPTSLVALYEADLSVVTPDGETVKIQQEFTEEEFTSIPMFVENSDGSQETSSDYTNYVVPARQVYAWNKTVENPTPMLLFIGILLITLVAMGTFRSPAVALMPDVTIKPLRSKANAVINLMGALGGIIILILGMVFGTGKVQNALMSYTIFFAVVALIMLISLAIFVLKVKEPLWVREMQEESEKYDLHEEAEEKPAEEKHKALRSEKISMILILASVVLWFMGYNAVTSKYSVYAGKVLGLDYNMSLTIASAAAIVSYIPIGMIASKVGRKKTIMAGIVILGSSFLIASFMREGSSMLVMNLLFAMAGIGWATINVNSYPMVVELSKSSNVGKFTGFYYTASMAAQTITPVLSGVFLDIKFTTLFPYATIFVFAAFITMFFVKHGDNKPTAPKSKLEMLNVGDDA